MIALITPTGGRPDQINLCALFMSHQSYTGPVTWIIIDDCEPRSTDGILDNFKENWTIIKYYPIPSWSPGQNTQARNISAGIQTLLANYKPNEIDGIFIIEDDDYYKQYYLENMVPRLLGFQAIGERNTIYYNVNFRTYFTHVNGGHSSLFQTAFTIGSLPIFEKCYTQRFIDMSFWSMLTNVNLFNANNLSIGIKGMPGRQGIGSGHTKLRNMPGDYNLEYLSILIGNDAKLYERYYGGGGQSQYGLLNKRRL